MSRLMIENEPSRPSFLWLLTLIYVMIIVLANTFDARLICLFGFTTDAGTLLFPLSCLISGVVTEVYGYQKARCMIWQGFLFNAFFAAFGELTIHIPSPSYAVNNAGFDAVIATNTRIIMASTFSYFVSEFINSWLIAKIKIMMDGRSLWRRMAVSAVIATGVDSFMFGVIAFWGLMARYDIFSIIMIMWFIKSFISILGLPLFARYAKKLKQYERMDVYDKNIWSNFFSLHQYCDDWYNKFGSEKT